MLNDIGLILGSTEFTQLAEGLLLTPDVLSFHPGYFIKQWK